MNGAGDGVGGIPLAERDTFDGLNIGDKINGRRVKMIVAHASVQGEYSAGAFAVFSGFTAGCDFDRAEGFHAAADEKLAVGRLSDVEAIEGDEGLILFGAIDVGLSEGIGSDAGNEE